MLPKECRLKKSREIRDILRNGRSARKEFLILKFKENNLSVSRFAFLISKKVSLKAVVRNRLRRKLHEAVRLNLPDIGKNIDAVLLATSDFSDKTAEELKKILYEFFN